jgi:O-antigen/teichoic acid export membrane protein
MNLFKTSAYTFISTAIKIGSIFIINKAVAVFIGPSGLAIIGQLQNFTQLTMTAAQGAITNGVVKFTAECAGEKERLRRIFGTSFWITLVCSIITGAIIVAFSKTEARFFLKDETLYSVFIVFGLTVVFFALNGLFLSIINGLQEIKLFVKANILQSVVTLIFTTAMIFLAGLKGALLAMVTNQSIVFFILLFMVRNHSVLRRENLKNTFSGTEAKKLLNYSLMAVISASLTPIAHLIIRNHITAKFGINAAGEWQAIWYISTVYLMVITTTLSVYYLPKLSSIANNTIELRKEILQGYKYLVPFIVILTIGIFLFRGLIIQILFTDEFLSVKRLFLFQLIGDVMKIVSWLLSYVMLAKAMTKTFIATEIIFLIFFVILSILLTNTFGLIGITYAYAINYAVYMFCMFFIFRKLLLYKPR